MNMLVDTQGIVEVSNFMLSQDLIINAVISLFVCSYFTIVLFLNRFILLLLHTSAAV